MKEEGWYTDPFARHEARWMSDGKPSKLVRDNGVESQDPPPDEAYTHDPQPVESAELGSPDDMRRADSAEAGGSFDPSKAAQAAWDAFPPAGPTP